MTSQPGKYAIAIHTFPYIARGNDNQTVKFGQLKEYNMRKIFLEKSYVVEKLVPNPFLKNQNWAHFWINSLKFYTVYLYCMPSWGL